MGSIRVIKASTSALLSQSSSCSPRLAATRQVAARQQRFTTSSLPLRAPKRASHGSSNNPPAAEPAPLSRDSLLFAAPSPAPSQTGPTSSSPLDPSSSTPPPPPPPPPPLATTEIILSASDGAHSRPSFPVPQLPFSTQRFVRSLEKSGIERKTAQVLMNATRSMLLEQERKASEDLLGRQDLENEAYLYTAALSELRTESGVKARNDGITLRSMTSALQRETDAVSQRLTEDMDRLRSDIQLDMNSRKEETSTELKTFDFKTMDLNSRFTVIMGDVRTEIEATKWISTRRVMTALIVIVVSILAIFTLAPDKKKKAEEEPHVPTVEELGVRTPTHGEADDSLGTASWWWSSTPAHAAPKSVPRVGEEADVENEPR